MFSKEQLEHSTDLMICEVIARAMSGEKITFNDLFGKSAIDKVTSASKQQPQKTNTLGKTK